MKFAVPAVVGEPLITPLVKVRPSGRAPALIENVTAPVPPVEPSDCENAEPTTPEFNGQAVEIVKVAGGGGGGALGSLITREQACVAEPAALDARSV